MQTPLIGGQNPALNADLNKNDSAKVLLAMQTPFKMIDQSSNGQMAGQKRQAAENLAKQFAVPAAKRPKVS